MLWLAGKWRGANAGGGEGGGAKMGGGLRMPSLGKKWRAWVRLRSGSGSESGLGGGKVGEGKGVRFAKESRGGKGRQWPGYTSYANANGNGHGRSKMNGNTNTKGNGYGHAMGNGNGTGNGRSTPNDWR